MKVLAINGSPRKDGNTGIMIKHVFAELEKEGIDHDLVNLGGQLIRGCTACMKCRKAKNRRCSFDDDIINETIEKMVAADGIIIGSPTYFATVNTETKALLDRSGYVARSNGNMFKRKVGAAVVSVRRAGSINAFQAINNFFLINGMIIPGSDYWNMGMGAGKGEVLEDKEGLSTMAELGRNMAWLLKRIV